MIFSSRIGRLTNFQNRLKNLSNFPRLCRRKLTKIISTEPNSGIIPDYYPMISKGHSLDMSNSLTLTNNSNFSIPKSSQPLTKNKVISRLPTKQSHPSQTNLSKPKFDFIKPKSKPFMTLETLCFDHWHQVSLTKMHSNILIFH